MKKIRIPKEFEGDYISRAAGEKLRHLINDAYKLKSRIELDFGGVIIASTSFFDEGIAKLALEGWDSKRFKEYLSFKNLNPRDLEVMNKMCHYRGLN